MNLRPYQTEALRVIRSCLAARRFVVNSRDVANQVEELLQVDAGLSGWEMDFIEEMHGRTSFRPRQATKIEEIWQRVLGNGN